MFHNQTTVLQPSLLYIHRPLDFINETKDRWVYCAAFGMLVNLFTILVVLGVNQEGANDLTAGS